MNSHSISKTAKKRVGESYKGSSWLKKSSKTSSSQATLRRKGSKEAYPLILPHSTKGLIFVNDDQRINPETLSARKTSEQKFSHVDSLRQLGIWTML